jgi:hypothetical protein
MITILFLWVLIFIVFYTIGFALSKAINGTAGSVGSILKSDPDEYFFLGFLTISTISGLLSIIIPLGYTLLGIVFLISFVLFMLNRQEIANNLQSFIRATLGLTKWELTFLILLFLFVLTASALKITLGDTESYHAQSIQWVRKFAVIPGLGNIHGRLAFNSMFLVVSGLFTFQIKDILIFPLNSLCYLVLFFKLFFLFRMEYKPGTRWKGVFYMLLMLISFVVVIPDLNSPAADLICATLVIYSFLLIFKLEDRGARLNTIQIVLLNAVIFSCIAYKISSLFLAASLLFLYGAGFFKRIWISVFIGILILSSFVIRNYYLSGYLIYPFPAVDIFNVDWKIPFGNALSEKLEIESWAKISTLPTSDVIHMKISDWVFGWFNALSFWGKILISFNLLSVISLVIMILKKEYFFLKIQLLLFLNLGFWFLTAPDPRFELGFLFVGFSMTIAFFIRLFESESFHKFIRIGLICFLIVIVGIRIKFPVNTLTHPSLWVIPAPFGSVAANEYSSDFNYRVPVPGGGCYNVEIPCVPYPLSGIVLRGKGIREGFKVQNIH